jgi:flagellar biosynthesis protein FlhG
MEKTQEWLNSFRQNESLKQNINIKESRTGITISITGGKGGVGKTTASLKIGKELANLGYKVLLIDCDYNLSNTLIKLGKKINTDLYDLITSAKTFDECLYQEGNFHILAGCNGNMDLFENNLSIDEVLIDVINDHRDQYDFILIDCPAGLQKKILNLNAYCDHRILVVNPDKSSITDSYSMMKILRNKYSIQENHLLVNRIQNSDQYKRIVRTISETAEQFLGCRTLILGGIPLSEGRAEEFDKFLLNDANSAVHKNFCKVTKAITEKCGVNAVLQDKKVFSDFLTLPS